MFGDTQPITRAFTRRAVDQLSRLQSVQSFGELSQFLSAAAGDEETLQMRDSMSTVASHIERVSALLQDVSNGRAAEAKALALASLAQALKTHHMFVGDLSVTWQSQFEFTSYVKSLDFFRNQVAHWLMPQAQQTQPLVATDFEVSAWRLLGGGALLIDVVDESRDVLPDWRSDATDGPRTTSAWARLLARLRRLWGR